MSIFDRDYEEVGSQDKGLILKTAGKIKIQWGKKFIDLLDSDGNINVKVQTLIKKISSESQLREDGFYYLNDTLVAKVGDNILELFSESGVSYVSFLTEQNPNSEEKYQALKNIGLVYETEDEANQYPTNGIIYIEDSQTLFIVKDGVLSKYTASFENPYPRQFVIAKEDDLDGALVIEGDGSENSLKFDTLKIYSDTGTSVIEFYRELQFKNGDTKVMSIRPYGLEVNTISSQGYDGVNGYRIYRNLGQYTLDIDYVKARTEVETGKVHSPGNTADSGFSINQNQSEYELNIDDINARGVVQANEIRSIDQNGYSIARETSQNPNVQGDYKLTIDKIDAEKEVKTNKVYSSDSTNGYILEQTTVNNQTSSSLTVDKVIARESVETQDVQTESIHSENADEDTGYQITLKNNKYVLDIDKINERIIDDYYDNELYSDRYIITKFDIEANDIEFETNPNVTLVENDIVEIPIRAIYNNVEDIYRLRFTVNSSGNLTTQENLSNYTFFEEKPFLRRSLYVVNTSGLKIDFKSFNALDSIKLLAGDISQYSGINNDIGLYSSNSVFLGGLFRKPFQIYDDQERDFVDPPFNWKYFPRYSSDLYNYLPQEIDDTIILPIGKVKELIYNPIEDVTKDNKTSSGQPKTDWNADPQINYIEYKIDCDSFYDGKIIIFLSTYHEQHPYQADYKVGLKFKIGEDRHSNPIYSDVYYVYNNNGEMATDAELDPAIFLQFNRDEERVEYFNASSSSSSSYSIENIIQQVSNLQQITNNASDWNSAATFVQSITNTPDTDSVINKWQEILDFFDTYTETDTLANLLANKLSLTGGQLTGDLSTSGNITATSFIKTNGTSSQFLKADGSVDSNTYVTTNTAQEITGKKTFKGSQVLDFKQNAATDKPSFTVYNSSSKEIGCFQYRPDSVNGAALMYLGHYNANPTTVDQTYVGFRSYTAANASQGFSTAAAYNLVSPLPRDAQATFNLTATYQTFYLPLGFKNGTTIVKTDSTGVVDLSSIVSSFSGDYNDLTNKPTIPTALSQLSDDSTHRLVTDTEKTTWNNKGTYSKPSGGIPKTDLASAVQTSLGKADTALQSYTETDPIFTASAAYGITSSNISSWNAKGTYSKPSGGIPKTDLASAVQTSLGKADTALQSYTESDPIFVASAAYGITSTDINNWNSKTSNSGTVTSITIKATSPISIDSSSAITTSGTRTLSHANSGVTAGTYRSVTVNTTGHVTSGTNPTTLSGYGITDAKIASGTITLGSNTITPLTSASNLAWSKITGTPTSLSGYGITDAISTSTTWWNQSIANGEVVGDLVMLPTTHNAMNADSAKLWFKSYIQSDATKTQYSPYIQAIYTAGYGRKRLGVFQNNATDDTYTTPHTEVLSILPNGRVGVGTTTPTRMFEVNGNGQFNAILTLYRETTTADSSDTTFNPAGISFTTKDTRTGLSFTGAYLYAYHTQNESLATPASNGVNLVMRGGGNLFIGSGEAPSSHYALYKNNLSEHTYITSDGITYIQSNADTIDNRVGFYVNTSGNLIPCAADAAANRGSIGTSNYRWSNIYVSNIDVSSSITADSFIKSSGTSSQFLKADGSVDPTAYLPLTGGTLTGELQTTSNISLIGVNDKKFQFNFTTVSGSAAKSNVDIGWNWSNRDGAGAAFRSSDTSIAAASRGSFELFARNATEYSNLVGQANGTLTWGGNNVLTAGNFYDYAYSLRLMNTFRAQDSQNKVNLNSYTTIGQYSSYQNSDQENILNKPEEDGLAFILRVVSSIGGSTKYIRQEYQAYTSSSKYQRYSNDTGATWSSWVKVQDDLSNYASSSSLNNYLPLSGGKMTGPLTWNDATAIPNNTSPAYVLTMDSFASGGTTKYANMTQLGNSLHVNEYLKQSTAPNSMGTFYDSSGNLIYTAKSDANGTTTDTPVQNSFGAITMRVASTYYMQLFMSVDNKIFTRVGNTSSLANSAWSELAYTSQLPTVNNATYTIKTKVDSTTTSVSDFTANQSSADDITFIQGSNITLTPDTTNRTITIAATDTNTDTKVTVSNTNPTSGTWYYPTWYSSTSGTGGVSVNDGLRHYSLQGTASAVGRTILQLGNGTASGTAGNKYGEIRIYSKSSSYSAIVSADTTATREHILPATAGTILNTGTTSFTQVLSSGTKIGTIKINGTSTDIYCETNTNTDTEVTQGLTNSSSVQLRPILVGYTSHSSDVSNFETVTNQVYAIHNIYVKPSTGTLYATNFIGNADRLDYCYATGAGTSGGWWKIATCKMTSTATDTAGLTLFFTSQYYKGSGIIEVDLRKEANASTYSASQTTLRLLSRDSSVNPEHFKLVITSTSTTNIVADLYYYQSAPWGHKRFTKLDEGGFSAKTTNKWTLISTSGAGGSLPTESSTVKIIDCVDDSYAANISDISATKITSGTLPIARGGTNAATALDAITNLGGLSISSQGVQIPSNSTIGNYKTPGRYFVNGSEVTTTLTDKASLPFTTSGFQLTVTQGYRAATLYQYITGVGSSGIYRRYSDNTGSSWSSWQKFAFTSDLDNYLPLNGGTISDTNFAPLTIERPNGAYASAIAFKNTNGILGYVGMTGATDGALIRFKGSNASTYYSILDTGNYTTTLDTRYVKQADVGNIVGLFTGSCASAADARAKVATVGSNFSLVDGVTVAIKFTNTNTYSATAAAPVTLNVNSTGAKQIYYAASNANTGTLAGVYGYADRYITYMYDATNDVWVYVSHGYDSDTNTQIRVYRQTSGYNADYPLLVSRTATIGTAGTNASYSAVYGVVYDSNQPTLNPSTGLIKVHALQVDNEIKLKSGSYTATIEAPSSISSDKTYTLPDSSGTLALSSSIPNSHEFYSIGTRYYSYMISGDLNDKYEPGCYRGYYQYSTNITNRPVSTQHGFTLMVYSVSANRNSDGEGGRIQRYQGYGSYDIWERYYNGFVSSASNTPASGGSWSTWKKVQQALN